MDKARKRYWISNENWIFNLESMHDKLFAIGEELDDGTISGPVEILGHVADSSYDLEALKEECSDFLSAAKSRPLSEEEYERAREIVHWRATSRYLTCMAAGMSEHDAGQEFNGI